MPKYPLGVQIISDGSIYPGIRADEQRHNELLNWLLANGIESNDVPTDSTVSIEAADNGHVIRHTVFLRNAAGDSYEDPATNNAAREERATPLTVPLPDSWPQPVARPEPDRDDPAPTP